jgi:hypothetical protein
MLIAAFVLDNIPIFYIFLRSKTKKSTTLSMYMYCKIASFTSLTEPNPRTQQLNRIQKYCQKTTEKLVFQVGLQGLALFFLVLYS